jgi:hypothetical protein
VHLPNEAPWLDDTLRELTGFPNLRYDDQVDSTTQVLQWVAMSFRKDGWLEVAARQTGRKSSSMVRTGGG